jgi:hypothetical protein
VQTLLKIVVGMALGVATCAAWAQPADCSMVPPSMQARCEEAMRIKKACAGLAGEPLKACQQKNTQYGNMKEDCSTAQGDARTRCEAHNKAMMTADPCNGKSGPELETCVKARAAAGK